MADFCRKCAEVHGFDPDLTIENLGLDDGYMHHGICEGCGYVILIYNHKGEEVIFRPDKPVVF